MESLSSKAVAMRISGVTIAVNVLLSLFKFAAGVLGHSAAMISDAVHSASDVMSTLIVMVGVSISGREADAGHPYGHDKLESVASVLLALILAGTGFGIGWAGVQTIFTGAYIEIAVPSGIALAGAVVSIVVKEWMYWYTRAGAKKINSSALMADAWHHRSDALSSVGSLIGIGGAILGFPICDPAASVLISLLIIKAAWDIGNDAVSKLVDASLDQKTVEEITALIQQQDGVLQVDEVMTRKFGSMFYVDVEIGCNADLSIRQGHEIAQRVHDEIELAFPQAKHCMVHVNPVEIPQNQ